MDNAWLAHLRHELRTPLNHVIGYSEMLLEDLEGDDAMAGLVKVLRGVHSDAMQALGRIGALLAPAAGSPPHLVARDALVELGFSIADAEQALATTDPELPPEERVRLALRAA